jgi:hypothetical protein
VATVEQQHERTGTRCADRRYHLSEHFDRLWQVKDRTTRESVARHRDVEAAGFAGVIVWRDYSRGR